MTTFECNSSKNSHLALVLHQCLNNNLKQSERPFHYHNYYNSTFQIKLNRYNKLEWVLLTYNTCPIGTIFGQISNGTQCFALSVPEYRISTIVVDLKRLMDNFTIAIDHSVKPIVY
jgi:hypothetical protein